ncbi:neurabin-1 [Plakobranchus ocellatus]|uniref:Neurabin-1 n=1 Tax=Plakobranchus ocellatus TaxID=259542 RepID=A0AAV3ZYG1_9GAST|nr:neurabin-1 [Plakobranchus ocellatus]
MCSANSIFKMANKDKAPGPEADPVLSSLVSKKPGCHLSRSTPAAPPCIASPSELAPDQSNELCVSEPGPSPRSKEAQSAGKTTHAKTFTGKTNRNKGKELVKHSRAKGRGSPTSASASEKPADATNNDDIRIIKNQMQVLMGLVPVISEMKSAYDSYLEDSREESECEGNCGIVNDDLLYIRPILQPSAPIQSSSHCTSDRNDDSCSDTSSSVSQTSYDPNRPEIRSGTSEIPDSTFADDNSANGDGGVTLLSNKSPKGFSFPKFNWKPSSSSKSGGGGVVLLSSRTLGSKHQSASDPGGLDSEGGITLVSRRLLDTGFQDTDAAQVGTALSYTLNISGIPAAHENPSPNKRSHNQFQSGPISEWNSENVCHWLMALELEKYSAVFTEKGINGSQLLQLDGSRLKALGVSSSKDRELLKKKIKEMKINVEREKKIQEKERKQKEKEQKKMSKKK